jgi:hypothetical protein
MSMEVSDLRPPHAHEVEPGVWLGDAVAAADGVWLAARGIRLVCNCTKDLPFHASVPVEGRHRVAIDDTRERSEMVALAAAAIGTVTGIVKARARGEPVLVHCFAGRQRSAAVVAMVLMVLRPGLTADAAVAAVRAVRPAAFRPLPNFLPTLLEWQGWCERMRAGFGTPDAAHHYDAAAAGGAR